MISALKRLLPDTEPGYRFRRSKTGGDHHQLVAQTEKQIARTAVQSSDTSDYHLWAFNESEIVKRVRRDGVVILPKFFNGPQISAINAEFARAFADPTPPYERYGKRMDILQIRNDGSIAPDALLPLYGEQFRSLAAQFFDGQKHYFNDPLVLNQSGPTGGKPILSSHYDDRQNLKFFVYLHDTGIEDGAFSIMPGTNRAITEYVAQCDAIGLRSRNRPNSASFKGRTMRLHLTRDAGIVFPVETDLDFDPVLVHLTEPAGTLIVFDTNTIHRGGIVAPGHERRIIRAHCQTVTERGTH